MAASSTPAAAAAPAAAKPASPATVMPSAGIVITTIGPGAIAIESSGEAVSLATAARVDKRGADGQFVPFESDESFRLTETCEPQASKCIDLRSGQTLRPARWTGLGCGGTQCSLGSVGA